MFRTEKGGRVEDPAVYVKEYIKSRRGTPVQVIIGSDSQNYGPVTSYATVIVLYVPGHGGHVLYERDRKKRERSNAARLLNEVSRSIATADMLKAGGVGRVDYIDIDINPDDRYKSSGVYAAAVGMVRGMGYECRCKTLGAAATYCADRAARR